MLELSFDLLFCICIGTLFVLRKKVVYAYKSYSASIYSTRICF